MAPMTLPIPFMTQGIAILLIMIVHETADSAFLPSFSLVFLSDRYSIYSAAPSNTAYILNHNTLKYITDA